MARRGRSEFIDDEDPLLTLALPLADATGRVNVAVATFLARQVDSGENLSPQAELLGMRGDELSNWAASQTPWPVEALERISDVVLDGALARQRAGQLQREADSLSINLASTYEEISLLHRLTQNLKLSKSDDDLGQLALEWLQEVVPAAGLAIQLAPTSGDKSLDHAAAAASRRC